MNCAANGELCLPFKGDAFAFRCPSGWAAAILLEPYNVGEREDDHRPLVVGGRPSTLDGRMNSVSVVTHPSVPRRCMQA